MLIRHFSAHAQRFPQGGCVTQKGQQSIEIDRVTFKLSGNMYILLYTCPWLRPFLHRLGVHLSPLLMPIINQALGAGGCWWLINPHFYGQLAVMDARL